MSEAIWFYEDNGERKGPVAAEFLAGLKTSGKVVGETLVWRDGYADWIPFCESLFPVKSRSIPSTNSVFGKRWGGAGVLWFRTFGPLSVSLQLCI